MLKSTASLRSFQISSILPFIKAKSPFTSSLYLTKPSFSYSVDPKQGRGPSNFRPNQPPQQPQPSPNRPRRGLPKALLILLAGLSGFGLSYYQYMDPEEKPAEKEKPVEKKVVAEKPKIGGSWRMLDTKGELITEKDFEGSYYLLYFGFCFCPDICPETMTKLSKSIDILKKDPKFPVDQLKTVFVSIDPDRDTPERIDKFLGTFGNDIVGVRGLSNEDPHLKDMLKKFRILVSKISLDGTNNAQTTGNSYTLDHTTIAYLMDKKNNCVGIFVPSMTATDVADLIKKTIGSKE